MIAKYISNPKINIPMVIGPWPNPPSGIILRGGEKLMVIYSPPAEDKFEKNLTKIEKNWFRNE